MHRSSDAAVYVFHLKFCMHIVLSAPLGVKPRCVCGLTPLVLNPSCLCAPLMLSPSCLCAPSVLNPSCLCMQDTTCRAFFVAIHISSACRSTCVDVDQERNVHTRSRRSWHFWHCSHTVCADIQYADKSTYNKLVSEDGSSLREALVQFLTQVPTSFPSSHAPNIYTYVYTFTYIYIYTCICIFYIYIHTKISTVIVSPSTWNAIRSFTQFVKRLKVFSPRHVLQVWSIRRQYYRPKAHASCSVTSLSFVEQQVQYRNSNNQDRWGWVSLCCLHAKEHKHHESVKGQFDQVLAGYFRDRTIYASTSFISFFPFRFTLPYFLIRAPLAGPNFSVDYPSPPQSNRNTKYQWKWRTGRKERRRRYEIACAEGGTERCANVCMCMLLKADYALFSIICRFVWANLAAFLPSVIGLVMCISWTSRSRAINNTVPDLVSFFQVLVTRMCSSSRCSKTWVRIYSA